MTPTEVWLHAEPAYLEVRRLVAPAWELSVHWTQRAVYARRKGVQLCIPFEACIIRYEGETPKGPGRPEKSGP